MKTFLFILVALLLTKIVSIHLSETNWQADAGLIPSYTEHIAFTASSTTTGLQDLNDNNNETFWQSEAPFPNAFIQRKDLNIFYKKAHLWASSPNVNDFSPLTDGDLNNAVNIDNPKGQDWLSLNFKIPKSLQFFAIKCGNTAKVEILATSPNAPVVHLATYATKDSYQWKRWELEKKNYQSILIRSKQPFQIFEVAALDDYPKEFVIADFGKIQRVGTIYCRHYSGDNNALKTTFYLSTDKKKWKKVKELAPHLQHHIISNIEPACQARYLKIEHTLKAFDWNKVFIWEVGVYNENGHYGAMPIAQKSRVNVGELLGINATWGWGHNKYSGLLEKGQGPQLHAPLFSHARNYHDLKWDLNAPTQAPDYQKMAMGKGTEVHWWLNWNQEYKAWTDAGLNVQTTLQIHNFKDQDWQQPYQVAYQIGQHFASHFGAKKGNNLVCTLEVGNEPWKYEAPTYRQILLGMAKGSKSVDTALEVFPCALQAADPSMENTAIFRNYMGARISEEVAPYLDGINIHCYSYINNEKNQRVAVHPEHPNSSFREINNAIRFRDVNMPNKKIYLSEWGWDCSGAGEPCTHNECVSERAAAAYAIRAAMIALRSGIDRATWFFFANENRPSSLFTRSGLTGSVQTGFKKKRPYLAFQNLVKLLGHQYFLKVIREDKTVYAYLLGDAKGNPSHLIAWKPIDGDSPQSSVFKWNTDFKISEMVTIDGQTTPRKAITTFEKNKGLLEIEVSAIPKVFILKK